MNSAVDLKRKVTEHEDVLSCINTLNKNLNHEIIFPVVENLAYFKGNIINTNSCKIKMGEKHFLETTNLNASKILEHRINRIKDLICKINPNEVIQLKPSGSEYFNEPIVHKLEEECFEIKEPLDEGEFIKIQKNIKVQNKMENFQGLDKEIEKMEKLKRLKEINISDKGKKELKSVLEPVKKKIPQNYIKSSQIDKPEKKTITLNEKKNKEIINSQESNLTPDAHITENNKPSLFMQDELSD
jgi:hypothetical protein